MTIQPRDSDRIRADALTVAIRKLRAGCSDCAERYFEIARANGATELEVQSARLAVASDAAGSNAVSTRRDFLKGAAIGVSGLAAAVAPAPIREMVGHGLLTTADAAQSNSSTMAWIAEETQFTALLPTGAVGPEIPRAGGSAVRANAANTVVVVTSRISGGEAATAIDFHAVDSGQMLASIAGKIFDFGNAPEFWDATSLAMSPSGRFVAILHSATTVTAKGGDKISPRIAGTVYGIEVVDVVARASVAYLAMPEESQLLPGAHLVWGNDDSRLYLFYLSSRGEGVGTSLGFDGSYLRTVRRAFLPNPGHAAPAAWVMPDGNLVRFVAPTRIEFIDTTQMAVAATIDVSPPTGNSKPIPPPVAIYDNGRYLYLADSARGQILTYDLVSRVHYNTASLPATSDDSHPRQGWGHPGAASRAALSPSGNQLLMVENRANGAGIWALDTSRQTVAGHFASTSSLGAIQFSEDGNTIFGLSYEHQSAVVLSAGGGLVGIAELKHQAIEFVAGKA